MGLETQETISRWADDTFGKSGSMVRVAARANEEMAELLRELSSHANSPKASEELADFVIVMARVVVRLGIIPQPEDWIGSPIDKHAMGRSIAGLAVYANRIFSHVIDLIELGEKPATIKPFLGELFLYLHRLAERMGTTVEAEVDKKMAINRAREWNLDGTGHGYHK